MGTNHEELYKNKFTFYFREPEVLNRKSVKLQVLGLHNITIFHKLKLLVYNVCKFLDTIRLLYSHFIICSIFFLLVQIKSEILTIFLCEKNHDSSFLVRLEASNLGQQR